MNLDGTNEILIPHQGNDTEPTWKPDGSKILFTSDRTGTRQLWEVNPDGSGLAQLTFFAQGAYQGRYSADGSKITFASGSAQGDIYTMDSTGLNVQQITSDPADEGRPTFSPSGSSILFVRATGPVFNPVFQIYAISAFGGSANLVYGSGQDEFDPCFSASGSHILFIRAVGGATEIFRSTAAGGSVTQISSDGANAEWPRAPAAKTV